MRAWHTRAVAILAMAAFVGALPATALSSAAEPVTLADWMRTIFVTPDREVDTSQPGLAAAPPPPPPVTAAQTQSEQTPPKDSVVRNRFPESWLRDRSRGRRRSRNMRR